MFKLLSLLFIASLCVNNQATQDSTQVQYDESDLHLNEILEEDLLPYHSDPDFDYEITKTEIGWWNDFLTWLGNVLTRFFSWLFGVEEAAGYLATFLEIIPYLLLGILLFLLIKFFLKVNSNAIVYSNKNSSIVNLSEDEHIIRNEDIDLLIQQALKSRDYRLAVRYYYLLILKLLSSEKHIEWEMQKTNDDYLKELTTVDLKRTI